MPQARTHVNNTPLRPQQTAADLGYRMPAEWEPVSRVWVTRPHNAETWPGCLDEAQRQFDDLTALMKPYVEVHDTHDVAITTNDSWIRDYGPLFVVNAQGGLACHDFVFNCWGGKYEPYADDNAIPRLIAKQLGLPLWEHRMVLEGGSIDVNGAGTVMTTLRCLLHPSRNPDLTQQQIEQRLHDTLGTRHVIWLPGGIEGDDTDGHIDDVARFISADTVAAVRAPQGHPDHDTLEHNWQTLQQASDQTGARLNLIELPTPELIKYDYPADEYTPAGPKPLPASYANFLIANTAVFVPTFGQPSDDTALRSLDNAMPSHTVVPVRCDRLVVGLGAIHCMTMQQPAGPAAQMP